MEVGLGELVVSPVRAEEEAARPRVGLEVVAEGRMMSSVHNLAWTEAAAGDLNN